MCLINRYFLGLASLSTALVVPNVDTLLPSLNLTSGIESVLKLSNGSLIGDVPSEFTITPVVRFPRTLNVTATYATYILAISKEAALEYGGTLPNNQLYSFPGFDSVKILFTGTQPWGGGPLQRRYALWGAFYTMDDYGRRGPNFPITIYEMYWDRVRVGRIVVSQGPSAPDTAGEDGVPFDQLVQAALDDQSLSETTMNFSLNATVESNSINGSASLQRSDPNITQEQQSMTYEPAPLINSTALSTLNSSSSLSWSSSLTNDGITYRYQFHGQEISIFNTFIAFGYFLAISGLAEAPATQRIPHSIHLADYAHATSIAIYDPRPGLAESGATYGLLDDMLGRIPVEMLQQKTFSEVVASASQDGVPLMEIYWNEGPVVSADA